MRLTENAWTNFGKNTRKRIIQEKAADHQRLAPYKKTARLVNPAWLFWHCSWLNQKPPQQQHKMRMIQMISHPHPSPQEFPRDIPLPHPPHAKRRIRIHNQEPLPQEQEFSDAQPQSLLQHPVAAKSLISNPPVVCFNLSYVGWLGLLTIKKLLYIFKIRWQNLLISVNLHKSFKLLTNQ